MRKLVFGYVLILLLSSCGQAIADPNNPLGDAGVSLIKVDFVKWLAENNYGGKSNDIAVITQATSTYRFYEYESLQRTIRFYKIKAINRIGDHDDASAYRVIGTIDMLSEKKHVFWDTGFFMPECGVGAEVSISEVSLLSLDGKLVVEFESVERPVMCAGKSGKVIRKTRLFLAEEPYSKVFEIENGVVNLHNDVDDTHSPEYRGAEIYPNACVGVNTRSCKYLTVIKDKKYTTYRWNNSFTKLVPLQ